jgi:hypothetical protein
VVVQVMMKIHHPILIKNRQKRKLKSNCFSILLLLCYIIRV